MEHESDGAILLSLFHSIIKFQPSLKSHIMACRSIPSEINADFKETEDKVYDRKSMFHLHAPDFKSEHDAILLLLAKDCHNVFVI